MFRPLSAFAAVPIMLPLLLVSPSPPAVLEGEIGYAGPESGAVVVQAYSLYVTRSGSVRRLSKADILGGMEPAGTTSISGPGRYRFQDLDEGHYGLVAFMDLDGDGVLDFDPAEPFGWYTEEAGDMDRLGARAFAELMITGGVDFDTICFRFTPDIYESVPASYYTELLDDMSQLGKRVFVWGTWFASNSANTEARFPHTEVTQRNELVEFMRINLENPLVIGVSLPIYDYVEKLPDRSFRLAVGLVDAGQEDEVQRKAHEPFLRVKPAYTALKEFWMANHPK